MTCAPTRLLRVAVSMIGLLGCTTPVENPPAYDGERDLCASELDDEWRRLVENCRARREDGDMCGGLISFTGQLEGQTLTVDSELGATEFDDVLIADGSKLRNDVKLQGRSPYFVFTFEWRGLGGAVTGEAQERSLSFGSGAGGTAVLDDDKVRGALRMSVGGETKAFAPRSGELTIELQTEEEQVASFETEFGSAGDQLVGCVHAFATTHRLARDDADE
jgi:hypothetical protein